MNLVEFRCKDVCLNIRPNKCYSLVYDGKAATRFPCIMASAWWLNHQHCGEANYLSWLHRHMQLKIKEEGGELYLLYHPYSPSARPWRSPSERVLMYRIYVILFLHYELSVNGTTVSISKKLNSLATRYWKKWLGLFRSTTVAIIHHPAVLNIPTLENWSTSAKISHLAAVAVSPDLMIQEIAGIVLFD